jgi:hypothetical protein
MFTFPERKVVELKPGDPGFSFTDGLAMYSRSAVEIDERCPNNIRDKIMIALCEGWLRPVAYMPKEQCTWDRLKEGSNVHGDL